MEYCCIRSCVNYGNCDKNIDLYPLPPNPKQKSLWVKAFGLSQYDVSNSATRVCGAHFRRKYFVGNKPEVNQTVNGSTVGPTLGSTSVFLLNNGSSNLFNTNCAVNDIGVNSPSNNVPIYLTFKNNPESNAYILHIPEATNSGNIVYQPNTSQNVPCAIKPQSINNQSYQNVSTVSSQVVKSDSTPSEPIIIKSPRTLRSSVVFDSCELYCQEESLTPEQEKYHHQEWLNFTKFTANVQNLPYISAVNGSEVGEKVSSSLTSSQELPVLIYSNAKPQTVLVPPVASSVSNTPVLYKIPSQTPSPLNSTSPVANSVSPVLNTAGPVVTQCTPPPTYEEALKQSGPRIPQSLNVPSVLPVQSSVVPVSLHRSLLKSLLEQNPEKTQVSENKDEEILPLVLLDSTTESLLNKVKEASLQSTPVSETENSYEPLINLNEAVPSPALSVNSGNDRSLSPDLLSNVEVNFEENESETLMESSPAFLGADTESDNSNGPKIVDVICGDAVVNEFYKGVLPDNVEEQPKDDSPANNGSAPSETSMPKTVTQWSIFSMQKTIAVISSGTVDASIRNLLGVRIHIPPITTERDIPTKLKNRLRDEHFLTLTPWWMIQKRYLPLNPPCTSCGGTLFRLNSCLEFLDNLCWTCTNKQCRQVYPVKRPKFFERFPAFTLEELLLLTYHWACKSRIWVVNYDVPVHAERIWEYFCALQDLCGDSVSRSSFIGKNTKHQVTVEVSAVKLGKFFVLCAYDRRNKVSRLKAITTEEACGSVKHIQVLQEWLGDNCTLITWRKISDEFLPNVTKVSADPAIGHVQSPGRHILNASKYLGKTMVQLFQNICHDQLTIENIQRVLDEVQWRERNGRTEESAFWGILNEITRVNDSFVYAEVVLGDIAKDRYYYRADVPFRMRWGSSIDVVTKTSTPNVAPDKPIETQQDIIKSVALPASKVVNSTVQACPVTSKAYASDIENSKRKHPISVPPMATNSKERNMSDVPISAQELLSIRILFSIDDKFLNIYRIQADKLAKQLKDEGYLLNPIQWLLKKNYIKSESTCYACQGPSKLQDSPKFSDGVSWMCQKSNCRFENAYQRPSFFRFGFKLEVIFAIIFHWAVQSDYATLTKAVPMNEFNIISVHRRLQKVCAEYQKSGSFKIGGKKHLVEVAFVRFANCFILGAMERITKHSRFHTFPSETKLHIDAIRKTLISWLWEDSTVIVNSNKYLGRYCMEERIHLVFADQSITDVNSKKYHTLTITSYLQNHIKTMFRSIKVQNMSAELLQVYLDELVWRERYGRNPSIAFTSILNCIFAVENKASSFGGYVDEATVLEDAASFYGFSLPLPEVKVIIEKLPDHVIKSYTAQRVEEVTIVDDFELTKEIKQEVVSDDEIEVVEVSNSKSVLSSSSTSIASSSSASIASSSSSLSTENHNVDNPLISVKLSNQKLNFSNSNILVKKSVENITYKRYSDKCYSRKRKAHELTDEKSCCIECKDVVSDEDHFVKQYSCSDCKCYVFSTFCQKAFARHRAFILFGRKVSNENRYNRDVCLSQKWYCSCGYGTREGNKLASHLIECRKSTCYLKSDNSITIL